MKYIVVDLEMNSLAKEYVEERMVCKKEVIEIGAVVLDDTYQEIGSFKTLVKPQYNDVISPYFSNLTGITTEMVENAPVFETALKLFFQWCHNMKDQIRIYQWSESDLEQIAAELNLKKITLEEADRELLSNWEDFQLEYGEKLNLTKLITCDGEIIGFVSLLTDSIKLKIINENAVKITIKNKLNISENNRIPAIKIGRFAISKKYAKKGLGSHILKSIILNIKNIAETEVGLRFIIVEGYASAYTFYVNHNNFHSLKKDENEIKKLDKIIQENPERTFDLYLDLKD